MPYWGSPWWRPCPVVVTVHDLIPLLLPLYRGGPLQRAFTALVSCTARRAHAVLTDSGALKRDIVAHLHIPANRVHAIYLATDPRCRPVTDPAELARVRARYRLPNEPFVLYLGGFDACKHVVRMIEAYARGQGTRSRGQPGHRRKAARNRYPLRARPAAGRRAAGDRRSGALYLEKCARDLTALTREGKLDPVIGRDAEILRVIQVLSRRTKNNPVLIGEAGVGKTAIVEGLAQKIVTEDVPEILIGKRLMGLDLGAMIAGTRFRGEFEERLKTAIEEVQKAHGQIILFIDELHTVVGAGSRVGG